MQVTK